MFFWENVLTFVLQKTNKLRNPIFDRPGGWGGRGGGRGVRVGLVRVESVRVGAVRGLQGPPRLHKDVQRTPMCVLHRFGKAMHPSHQHKSTENPAKIKKVGKKVWKRKVNFGWSREGGGGSGARGCGGGERGGPGVGVRASNGA